MKRALLLCVLWTGAPLWAAEPVKNPEPPSARVLLQEGLFAEEAERDLAKAGERYAELLALIDAQRALEATALYRLAEIRVRQGKPAEAVALHQRLLAEYPREEALVKLSRDRLAALGTPAAAPSKETDPAAMMAAEAEELKRMQGFAQNSPDLLEAPDLEGFTPLVKATGHGWLRVATFLLDHGAKINGHPEDSVPLHGAAGAGHKRMVEFLLERGADVNASYEGWTALHGASDGNRLEVARVLLKAGAKADQVATNAVRFAAGGATPLLLAVNRNAVEMVKLLLDQGAEPSRVDPVTKITPLLAAVDKDREGLVKLLLEHKAQVDQAGMEGRMTPLLLSAHEKRPRIAQLLLQAGARTDPVDALGFTALHYAAQGDLPLVEALLAAGASATAATKEDGWTPLNSSLNQLAHAQMDGEVSLQTYGKIWAALITHGADINAYDRSGFTLLQGLCRQYATQPNDFAPLGALELLVEVGADPLLKTKDGFTLAQLVQGRFDLEKRVLFPRLIKENAVSVFTATWSSSAKLVYSEPVKYSPEGKDAAPPTLLSLLQKTSLEQARAWQVAAHIYRRGPDGAIVEAPKVPLTPDKTNPIDAPALQWGDVVVFQSESLPISPK